MFEASGGFRTRHGYYHRGFDQPASLIGGTDAPQLGYRTNVVDRKRSTKAVSYIGNLYDNNPSHPNGGVYRAVNNQRVPIQSVKLSPHMLELAQRSNNMENSTNYTLPLENNAVEDMIKTFMACQKCKEITTRSKHLQCSHTICQRCALLIRTRHVDPGQWMIRCLVCNLITTWYGKNLEGLSDNSTMQNMIKQKGGKSQKGITKSKNGQITMYGDEDLTINIVSFSKEKAEIQKVLDTAERKIQICQQQTKQVKEYEKRVNEAKSLVRRQIEHSAEMFISSIRSQQAQLMEDVDDMFEKDFHPVQEAKDAIEVQMQSLQLVTQCCCVASRILHNGGAPLDLDNFKRMVWQTMKKTRAGKLPTAIQRAYKANTIYKANEGEFDDMAEKLGCLVSRKQKRKDSTKRATSSSGVTDIQCSSAIDDEPVYDLPPDLEIKYAQVNKNKHKPNEDEDIYDEIPFFSESEMKMEEMDNETLMLESHPPLPIQKDNHEATPEDIFDYPPPPPPAFLIKNIGNETLDKAAKLVASRRRAINGVESDSSEEDDEFSSDSSVEDNFEAQSTAKSKSNSDSGQSTTEKEPRSRSQSPARSVRLHRHKSISEKKDDHLPRNADNKRRHGPITTGYESQPAQKGLSHAIRRRSMKNINAISSHIQTLIGSGDTANIDLDSEKLLFCVGKAKKSGSRANNVQQFNSPPEFTISDDDRIWISDSFSHRVQIHEGNTGKLTGTFKTIVQGVGLKPKGITTLSGGKKVAVTCGKYATVWTEGGDLVKQIGPYSDFGKLGSLTTDSNGKLVLSDVENANIIMTGNNKIIPAVTSGGAISTKSQWPGRIAINSLDQVICPDYGAHDIKIFSKTGTFITKFGSFGVGTGQFRYPSAVAVDSQNRIYVADECNNRISVFSANGEEFISQVLTKDDGLAFPHAISIFSDGAIAVSDDSKVIKIYKGLDIAQ